MYNALTYTPSPRARRRRGDDVPRAARLFSSRGYRESDLMARIYAAEEVEVSDAVPIMNNEWRNVGGECV